MIQFAETLRDIKQPPKVPLSPIWVREPFRVFFPLGILASIFGTLIWPLFYAEVWPFPPHIQHPRIMIFGFGFAFVTGFLGTAWPRFLDTEAIRRTELALLIITWLVAQIAYSSYHLRFGDWAFSAHALALLVILSVRLKRSQSKPPPGFALAFTSVFLGLLVVLIWAITPDSQTFLFSKLLAWQGILLLPLLGVGAHLFPRFFQTPGVPPVTPMPSHRFIGIWGTALLIIISFIIEANGWVRLGNAVRFGAMVIWALLAAPVIWKAKSTNTRAWGLRIGIGSIALSFLVRAIWPSPGYAFEHILFLGGFGITLLLMGDRVSLGHGGDMSTQPAKSTFWRWLIWLILLTAATRVSADLKASLLISHHVYAALLWVIIVAVWSGFHAKLWRVEN